MPIDPELHSVDEHVGELEHSLVIELSLLSESDLHSVLVNGLLHSVRATGHQGSRQTLADKLRKKGVGAFVTQNSGNVGVGLFSPEVL